MDTVGVAMENCASTALPSCSAVVVPGLALVLFHPLACGPSVDHYHPAPIFCLSLSSMLPMLAFIHCYYPPMALLRRYCICIK